MMSHRNIILTVLMSITALAVWFSTSKEAQKYLGVEKEQGEDPRVRQEIKVGDMATWTRRGRAAWEGQELCCLSCGSPGILDRERRKLGNWFFGRRNYSSILMYSQSSRSEKQQMEGTGKRCHRELGSCPWDRLGSIVPMIKWAGAPRRQEC